MITLIPPVWRVIELDLLKINEVPQTLVLKVRNETTDFQAKKSQPILGLVYSKSRFLSRAMIRFRIFRI
jgi:hypothetical protein